VPTANQCNSSHSPHSRGSQDDHTLSTSTTIPQPNPEPPTHPQHPYPTYHANWSMEIELWHWITLHCSATNASTQPCSRQANIPMQPCSPRPSQVLHVCLDHSLHSNPVEWWRHSTWTPWRHLLRALQSFWLTHWTPIFVKLHSSFPLNVPQCFPYHHHSLW